MLLRKKEEKKNSYKIYLDLFWGAILSIIIPLIVAVFVLIGTYIILNILWA